MSDAIQHPAVITTVKAAAALERGLVVNFAGGPCNGASESPMGVAQAKAAQGEAASIATIGDLLVQLDTAAIGAWDATGTKTAAAGTKWVITGAGKVAPIAISGTASNAVFGVSLEPLTAISGVIQGFPDPLIRLHRALFD